MRKALMIGGAVAGGAVAGGALLAKRLAPKMANIDWEQKISALPDSAPPKWMFTNIRAIRENTDQILELLKEERGQPQRDAE
jgi:hypothetical protein